MPGEADDNWIESPAFRELLVRWFEWAAFCPIMRMHGTRQCTNASRAGFATCPNEPWSFGPDVEKILTRHIHRRVALKPYTLDQMQLASLHGQLLMRPLFWDFGDDPVAKEQTEAYLFGSVRLRARANRGGRSAGRALSASLPLTARG